MTPHDPSTETVGTTVFVLVVLLVAVLTTVGVITCVVVHYQHHGHHHHHRQSSSQQTTDCSTAATAHLIWNHPYCNHQANLRNSTRLNATTAPMLALEAASMERERCALRDRQVRLHSVHTDLELGLPTSIHLPDGEETPYGSSTRLHIRDAEQESEIYRKCIRPPPNRTIEQSDSILPYRSSSTGLLSLSSTSSSNSSNDWTVVRCNSMSGRHNIQSVILPSSNSRSQHGQGSAGLKKITMVPCLTDHRSSHNAGPDEPSCADVESSKCLSSGSSASSSGGSSRLPIVPSLTIAPTIRQV